MAGHGAIFKKFVEDKKLVKTKLAEDLGMTQQNLYQLFRSREFQPETIKRIEKALRIRWPDLLSTNIYTNNSAASNGSKSRVEEPGEGYKVDLITQAIYNLSLSAKNHSDAAKDHAMAEKTRAEIDLINARNIQELLQRSQPFADESARTLEAVLERAAAAQEELLASLAELRQTTVEEVDAAVDRRVRALREKDFDKGSH